MDTLPRDILGIIAAKPSIARPLSYTCRAIRDSMRGLFRVDYDPRSIGDSVVNAISGPYFSSAARFGDRGAFLMSRDPGAEIVIECDKYYYRCSAGVKKDMLQPRNVVFLEYYGEIYGALASDLPDLLEFAGIVFSHAFVPLGYYNNYEGVPANYGSDYYCTSNHIDIFRTNTHPMHLYGGVTHLKLIYSAADFYV